MIRVTCLESDMSNGELLYDGIRLGLAGYSEVLHDEDGVVVASTAPIDLSPKVMKRIIKWFETMRGIGAEQTLHRIQAEGHTIYCEQYREVNKRAEQRVGEVVLDGR